MNISCVQEYYFDSPILLEVLGDLLYQYGEKKAARQLAARAYLKAAMQVDNEKSKAIYHKKVEQILYHQTVSGMKYVRTEEVTKYLLEEIAAGDAYFEKICRKEIDWIKNKLNPEVEFAKHYYLSPTMKKRKHSGVTNEFANLSFPDRPTSKGKILTPFPRKTIQLDRSDIQEIYRHYLDYTKHIHSPKTTEKIKAVNSTSQKANSYLWAIIISLFSFSIIGVLFYLKQKEK